MSTTEFAQTTAKSKTHLYQDQNLINPCLKEHQLSLKCLDDNDYDHDKCKLYFENYKICKKFWAKVTFDRKTKGIVPHIPLPEERNKIKADYLNSLKK